MGKNIQIKDIKNGCLTLRIGDNSIKICEDRDLLPNLSSLINGHYLYHEHINDTDAIRIKTKAENGTLYLTSWIVPDGTDYKIVIVWEDISNDFFVDMRFKYDMLREEFMEVTSKISKEYKSKYLKKGKKDA